MRDIEKIGKILGLAIAALYLIFFQGNEIFEWILFATILLTIGIPHGALDHLLLNPKIDNKGLIKFIIKYLAIIIGYLIVWIYFPVPDGGNEPPPSPIQQRTKFSGRNST